MAKIELTDGEKREILQCLEQGKPLDDRFRFLLFGDKREVELVWNGKTNEVCNVVLPFQVVEQVDEPRGEKKKKGQADLFSLDGRGRQLKGWTNKLIWGDNKLILSSLKNGPMRAEIEKQGGIKLIYIDPPFDVGADFSMDIEIGDETFHKEPNILEEIAYRDTWGKGLDSFIAMIYERLSLMRDLLANDGSIYVHCDWRVTAQMRSILDEVFGGGGEANTIGFKNEIIWKRTNSHNTANQFGKIHDTIYYYTKTDQYIWNIVTTPFSEEQLARYDKDADGRSYTCQDLTAPRPNSSSGKFEWRGTMPSASRGWGYSIEQLERWWKDGRIATKKDGSPRMDGLKVYLDEKIGQKLQSIWDDVHRVTNTGAERLGYPTQKPEALLDRIIKTSSNEGDLVADFFSGSGTTAAVAEKLGRKWIVSDLGKFAIHTTRKRLISVQRQLKEEGKDFRAFEVLNLGKYERQHYIGVNVNLREEQQQKQLQEKERDFVDLILRAYKAEKVASFNCFLGKKAGRLVAVGPINMPVTRLYVEEIILECRLKHITKADILAFEFEMGLFPNILDDATAKGIDLAMKYIPRDVFDKRAIEKDEVVFHDVSFIEVTPRYEGKTVAVELTDFSVFYSQDTVKNAATALRNGKTKIVVENGRIIKVTKSKIGEVKKEVLTKHWTDWIDYWSVDFDFESKREIIRVQDPETGEVTEQWSGDYVFENEWQSFRTKKDRSLELKSIPYEYEKGKRYKIAVKVVDIFGNDTMKIIEVGV